MEKMTPAMHRRPGPIFFYYMAIVFTLFSGAVNAQNFNHVTVLAPTTSDSFYIGDTIHIRFTADSTVPSVTIEISTDNGFMYYELSGSAIAPGSSLWGDYQWVVPETLYTRGPMDPLETVALSVVSNKVKIQITDQYNRSFQPKQYPSGAFRILPKKTNAVEKQTVTSPALSRFIPNPISGNCRIAVPADRLSVFTLSGRLVLERSAWRGMTGFDTAPLSPGVYVINADIRGWKASSLITIMR